MTYKFDVLAVNEDGDYTFCVVESAYRWPPRKYIQKRMGRGWDVLNFTAHVSDEDYEKEFTEIWDLVESGHTFGSCLA